MQTSHLGDGFEFDSAIHLEANSFVVALTVLDHRKNHVWGPGFNL